MIEIIELIILQSLLIKSYQIYIMKTWLMRERPVFESVQQVQNIENLPSRK